jgi:hypothetical protein
MNYTFSLKINTNELSRENLESIIGLKSNTEFSTWEYEFEYNRESDEYINFIQYFMDVVEDKLPILDSLGVKREEITIWMLFAYEFQCNMEFDSDDLLRLGRNGIKLCITCYDVGVPPNSSSFE